VDDGLRVQALGGDERKPVAEIEAHLVTEDRQRAGAGPVFLAGAVVADVPHEGQVLLHIR